MSRPDVVIFGTGGLATVFGARLGRLGRFRVTLVGSWAQALARIANEGLTVIDEEGSWTAPAHVAHVDAPPPHADVVLVLVKSGQTARVASRVSEAASTDGIVSTLQNGLGNREALEAALERKVIQGVTTVGATLLGPGAAKAFPGRITLGLEKGLEEGVAFLAAILRDAGFDVDLAEDIDAVLWKKLAVNCAINPLTALLEVTNGVLLDSEETRGQLIAAAREVGALAQARGIDLGIDPAALALDVARRTASNRSSMLQDLLRGVPTEIESLCGAVCREGQRLGLPTPVNARLLEEVRRRESTLAGAFVEAGSLREDGASGSGTENAPLPVAPGDRKETGS